MIGEASQGIYHCAGEGCTSRHLQRDTCQMIVFSWNFAFVEEGMVPVERIEVSTSSA